MTREEVALLEVGDTIIVSYSDRWTGRSMALRKIAGITPKKRTFTLSDSTRYSEKEAMSFFLEDTQANRKLYYNFKKYVELKSKLSKITLFEEDVQFIEEVTELLLKYNK